MEEWRLERSEDVLRPRPLQALARPLRERAFVYDRYTAFLDRLVDRRFVVVPLRELATAPRDRVVVGIRHDVDDRLAAALELGRLEFDRGLRSTYFVLHTAPYYRRVGAAAALRRLQGDYGHEVGFHNDLLSVVAEGGDAGATLTHELAWLRGEGLDVRGVAAHGSRWSHRLGASSDYLFDGVTDALPGCPNLDEVEPHGRRVRLPKLRLEEFGLDYDANRLPFNRFYSDARFDARGRRWHPDELAFDELEPGDVVVVLVHPCHWDRSALAKTTRVVSRGPRRALELTRR